MDSQKAKLRWLREGDQNSKFFHSLLTNRRNKAVIDRLELDDGSFIVDEKLIEENIVKIYPQLYRRAEGFQGGLGGLDGLDWSTLERSAALELEMPFSEAEIKKAVFQSDGNKAPGPDGFTLAFFQHNWALLKVDLLKVFTEFFEGGVINGVTNETFISLIPKKQDACRLTDFRPISLITSLYKIVAKVLANRIKNVMQSTIAENRCAFIKGRQILDCCIVANEVVEEYRKRKMKGWVFKVDKEKAYDNVDCQFLDFVLQKKGFGDRWRRLIRGCVTNVSFSIFINGRPRGKIKGERGIRQGDPLSPFLFNLVVDVLGRMVDRAKSLHELRGLVVGKGKFELSHIQFADDSLFMVQTRAHIIALVELIKAFGQYSGLKINFQKSLILGINIEKAEVLKLAQTIGCKHDDWPIMYLGAPLGGRPTTIEFWEPVLSKMKRKLASWKKAFLSRGGRLTLIKSVLCAMPSYYMSLFMVPKKVAKIMERTMRDFLWDGSDGEKHCHLVSWENVCKPRERGGLGLGNIELRNRSLLGKWWWRGTKEKDTLWKKVIKSIYGMQDNEWDLALAKNGTFRSPWKFISRTFPAIQLLWGSVLRGGNSIRFWEDEWGDRGIPFKDRFPALFRICTVSNKPILNFLEVTGIQGAQNYRWDVRFRRDLDDLELEQFVDLMSALQRVRVQLGVDDYRVWLGDNTGMFSVKSFYDSFFPIQKFPTFPAFDHIWKVPVPQTVQIFSWIVALGKIPTADVVQRRWPTCALCPNWCPLCQCNEESQDHLLIHCSFTRMVWSLVMQEMNFQWVFPRRAADMFISALGLHTGRRASILWFVTIHMLFWSIWLERNNRIFKGKRADVNAVWELIKFRVASTITRIKDFHDLSVSDVIRDLKFVM